MKKFLTKFLISLALMPVGYVLGIMLTFGIVDIVGLMSVERVPTPVAASPPTQIKAPPPPAKLANEEQKPAPPTNVAPIYRPTPDAPPTNYPLPPSRDGVIPMPPSLGGFDGLTTVIHPILRYCSSYGSVVPWRVVPSTE
jgi:hypothetical protein